jgi:hypothetical protein
MGRTRKNDPDDLEEFNEEALHLQEAPYKQADHDGPAELGDPERRSGFDRLNDEELFRYRDF